MVSNGTSPVCGLPTEAAGGQEIGLDGLFGLFQWGLFDVLNEKKNWETGQRGEVLLPA